MNAARVDPVATAATISATLINLDSYTQSQPTLHATPPPIQALDSSQSTLHLISQYRGNADLELSL